jgi:putative transposase
MLSDKTACYEESGKQLRTTPAQYKTEFEWLREVDSLALANEQLHLEAAYRNFFRDKNIGFPKFKSKNKGHSSYTTNLVNGNIVLDGGFLKLPKLGKVKIKQHRRIPEGYLLKSVTVSFTPSGKYFVSVLYEYAAVIKTVAPERVIGLDYSMNALYIDSNGESAFRLSA